MKWSEIRDYWAVTFRAPPPGIENILSRPNFWFKSRLVCVSCCLNSNGINKLVSQKRDVPLRSALSAHIRACLKLYYQISLDRQLFLRRWVSRRPLEKYIYSSIWSLNFLKWWKENNLRKESGIKAKNTIYLMDIT